LKNLLNVMKHWKLFENMGKQERESEREREREKREMFNIETFVSANQFKIKREITCV